MFPFRKRDEELAANAITSAQLIVAFDVDGKAKSANARFCDALEYDREEIAGLPYQAFFAAGGSQSPSYSELRERLRDGHCLVDEFKLTTKHGREIWLLASYSPMFDRRGRARGLILAGFETTLSRQRATMDSAQLAAASRAQAIIEFETDGTILTANSNFLNALGYRLDEIQGQHHRMLVHEDDRQGSAYEEFWARLRAGELIASEFRRIGKGGRDVFIQASYNPIFDDGGRIVKVVKFATDVTGRVLAVQNLQQGLARLAEGDLQHRIEMQFAPAIEPLRQSFNFSLDRLEATLTSIVGSVNGMQSGLSEIAIAARDLAYRTEQQAASLEQTVAALSEITEGAKHAASSADEVKNAATLAEAEGRRGSDTVARAVHGMGDLEQSSRKIERIIDVIDEIAFQTNLLALNAGVEAARAGEAGRGFAVVAQEVRGLAQRSAEAAKEIKELIATSADHVDEGVELVSATGRSFEKMSVHIVGVAALVVDMATHTKEQSISLAEVSTAADQMDRVTQQNAAMVEETTAAVQNLLNETTQLSNMVRQFQIAGARPLDASRGSPSATIVKSTITRQRPSAAMVHGASAAKLLAATPVDEWSEF